MWTDSIIGSLGVAVAVGIAMGFGFRFFTGDSKLKTKRDLALGLMGSLIGWIFGMLVPIMEPYKLIGADFLSVLICGYALHTYWAVFKERTNLMKNFDADSPDQVVQGQARPKAPISGNPQERQVLH